MSEPAASVVICAWSSERWALLARAVASVQADAPDAEIVVVSDHNPALAERARRELAGVDVVENADRRGLSGARNTGIRAARGEVVAFLDDDAAVEPGWLAALLAPYADARVIAVGGWIAPEWATARPRWLPAEFDWVVGCSYRGMPERRAEVRNLIGANMSFRASVFAVAGGFSHDVGRTGARPTGCEETELCIRARRALPGSRIVHEPAARVRHHVPAIRATFGYFRSRCFNEGLSKATVAQLAGAGDGLSSEWAYTLRTLPLGVLHGLRDTVTRRDPWGLARAAAIIGGLAITTAGYLVGRVRQRIGR